MVENHEREYLFDNTRFVLILLVVIGHALDYYIERLSWMKYLFLFIYIFHMPVLIFISGYFSKSNSKRFKIEKFISYLSLYVIMKLFYYFINLKVFEKNVEFHMLSEGSLPWYLFVLAVWLVATYILRDLKMGYVCGGAVAVAVCAGYDTQIADFFCVSRTLVFFPFFLLGYYMPKEAFMRILHFKILKYVVWAAGFLFILLLVWHGDFFYEFRGMLTGRNPYENINALREDPRWGALYRIFYYVIAVLLGLAFIYIIPKRKIFFTKLGERTLQVFFYHIFVLEVYHRSGLGNFLIDYFPKSWSIIYLSFAIVLTFVLSTKYLEWPFKKLMSLEYRKIIKECEKV